MGDFFYANDVGIVYIKNSYQLFYKLFTCKITSQIKTGISFKATHNNTKLPQPKVSES